MKSLQTKKIKVSIVCKKLFCLPIVILFIFSLFGCKGNEKKPYSDKTIESANISDLVLFGSFEQDGNVSNGSETIEWIVLDKSEDEMVLISKYCLEVMPWYYDSVKKSIWAISDIRIWLNNDFYNNAFTETEKSKIVDYYTEEKGYTNEQRNSKIKNKIINNDSHLYTDEEIKIAKEYTGYDKVFILDAKEFYQYFDNPEKAVAQGTNYAISKRLYTENDSCLWWLRTSKGKEEVSYVKYDGTIFESGSQESENLGIRPVIVVKF